MDSLDDIAAAALWNLRNAPVEQMGAIYSGGGGYGYTATTGGGQSTAKGTVRKPAGTAVAGFFHNHPGDGRNASEFSTEDKGFSRRAGVPSYITVPDGRVMRFDPRNNTTQEVLAQFPMEAIPARISPVQRMAQRLKNP